MKKILKTGDLRIGTSGWMYKDWGKKFYPPEMKKGHLSYLSKTFNTVEVNSSFYHLPLKSTFAKWSSETPDDFVFAVKLSRFITHQKKIAKVREPLERFLKNTKGMEKKLRVILIQLPPFLKYDEKLLTDFLEDIRVVSKRNKIKARYALELRHLTWMEKGNAQKIRKYLKKENIALVFAHSKKIPFYEPTDENLTADFVYVRFHGPSEFAASRYGARRLTPWATRLKKWRAQGKDIFVYFNNDINGHAVVDALTLKKLISK